MSGSWSHANIRVRRVCTARSPVTRRLFHAARGLTRTQVPERVLPDAVLEDEDLRGAARDGVAAALLLELQRVVREHHHHRAVPVNPRIVELDRHELTPRRCRLP